MNLNNNKMQELDFAEMIKASAEIRAKQVKSKKPTTSVKPLKFDTLDGDSPLKQTIVARINDANLTYSDLYAYCAKIKGDIEQGNKMGSNLINGLKTRHTMIDTTFSLLCDFLGYDVYLVPRKSEADEDVEDGNEESED